MLTPFFASHGLSQSLERRLILPRGLTDGGAYHELEDLILALARRLYGGDVLVGDPCRLPGDFVDQRAQRLGEPCVIECGAPRDALPSPSRTRVTTALCAVRFLSSTSI